MKGRGVGEGRKGWGGTKRGGRGAGRESKKKSLDIGSIGDNYLNARNDNVTIFLLDRHFGLVGHRELALRALEKRKRRGSGTRVGKWGRADCDDRRHHTMHCPKHIIK